MKINRNNLPVWITDFHDGLLTASQQEELLLFLDENADMKEEFELAGTPLLFPDISLRIKKEPLRKEFCDLSPDQQEELLVALIEGDLQGEEADMILSIAEHNPDVSGVYHSLSGIKLIAPPASFPGKSKLRRFGLRKSAGRIAIYVLSAVATATILVSLSFFKPDRRAQNNITGNHAGYDAVESTVQVVQPVADNSLADKPGSDILEPATKINNSLNTDDKPSGNLVAQEEAIDEPPTELVASREREVIIINRAPASVTIPVSASNPTLLMAEMTPAEITEQEDEPEAGGFIASSIRRLIPNREGRADGNINASEIAGATVNGVNKIFGWDMKLEKDRDEKGNVSSVRFSSQLITVDHKKKSGSD